MNDNIVLLTDSYKIGHAAQYPAGTTNVFSYFESRGGHYPCTVFFGLQYIMEKYLTKRVTQADVDEAAYICEKHFGSETMFNRKGWEHIVNAHGGRLPVRIRAVPEGTVVPTHNALITIENTDPEVPWLTNYLETIISQVWYPITVATTSWAVRQVILDSLNNTGTPESIDFKLHDFGFRGASSGESAALGGAAHLTSFLGTDTLPALLLLRDYYHGDVEGFSVPASEHSTMTAWGRDKELEAYANMIETYGHMPFYSVVSDSYDVYRAARELFGEKLKDKILDAKGTLVVRPDSGDPPKVVIDLLEILGEKFGVESNVRGFKVLNPKVRVIWGDGLEPRTIQSILRRMHISNWSADNIVFGMGGGLLQKVNRDTQKFAFKCSSIRINNEDRDVYKNPITDPGKVSKRGRLALVMGETGYMTVPEETIDDRENLLQVIYENGDIFQKYSIEQIRMNVKHGSKVLTKVREAAIV